MVSIHRGYSLVSVNILFWMPDYENLVQEFFWQTEDVRPEYPRINRFLCFWKQEIDAVIKEIRLNDATGSDITTGFRIYDPNKLWH